MLRRGRLERENLQGLRARGRRFPPLPGRQRHDRRALHVGLDRRRAQARSLIRPVRDRAGNFEMTASPIYLTEAEVGRLVTVKDAIATLEALFATWGQPSTSNLPRQRARLAGGAFNLMGAAYGAKGVHGLKAYAGVKGAQFHRLLYSSLDGKLKAMIEADLFGQMRTGAASGLATKLLANRDAEMLGVIGTGKQSRMQVAAVCAVRPIKRVKVFARTAERRETYARAMESELNLEVRPAPSGQACVAEADVVVTITNSAEPVCRADWLAEGAHVNVAGANSYDRREVDPGARRVCQRQSHRPDIAVRPDAVQIARHCARGCGFWRARLSARARRGRRAADPDLSGRRCGRSQECRSPAMCGPSAQSPAAKFSARAPSRRVDATCGV